MNDDLHAIEVTKNIFEFLCDVKVIMGLTCIMPMLEAMHELIKFAQCHDTFVWPCGNKEDALCRYVHILLWSKN
jgi:hypothetical protein